LILYTHQRRAQGTLLLIPGCWRLWNLIRAPLASWVSWEVLKVSFAGEKRGWSLEGGKWTIDTFWCLSRTDRLALKEFLN